MQRAFVSILSGNPDASARFYESLLGMTRHADFGWFVILTHPKMPGLEYGLLDRTHDIVPEGFRAEPSGVLVTFVVEAVDDVHAKASAMGATIVETPTDMPYGQRRMLVQDLDGTLIDISSPTAPPPA